MILGQIFGLFKKNSLLILFCLFMIVMMVLIVLDVFVVLFFVGVFYMMGGIVGVVIFVGILFVVFIFFFWNVCCCNMVEVESCEICSVFLEVSQKIFSYQVLIVDKNCCIVIWDGFFGQVEVIG